MSKYFQGIYNKDNEIQGSQHDIKEFLDMDNDTAPWEALEKRRLSKEHAESMEGDLTLDELTEALFKHMNPLSSPGIDGFTVAYLKVFWNSMKYVVKDMLNSIQTDRLSQTLRSAIVKLLRKGDKNPLEISSYRPISLLSIFYKLASCCITRRIKLVVESLIGMQQKAYIESNNIGSCILNILNLMENMNKKNFEFDFASRFPKGI